MHYFCTYFDRNFLYQGLALYYSLCDHAGEFTLWALCFDDTTYELLNRLNLPGLNIIRQEDFEAAYPALDAVKKERSFVEYYWTTTPFLTRYLFNTQPDVDIIAYLDADIFFYRDITPIYEEWDAGSIYIIPHRFAPGDRQEGELKGGIYNVGFVGFRRDSSGLSALERWSKQCLDWCSNRCEPGLLGDQKYLDDWPERFAGVVLSQNHGVGAGGWNIAHYRIRSRSGQIYLNDSPLIMLHLNFIDLLSTRFFTTVFGWALRPIYRPYSKILRRAVYQVKQIAPDFQPHFKSLAARHWLIRYLKGGIAKI